MKTSEYGFIFGFKAKFFGFCLLVGCLFLSAACRSAVTPIGNLGAQTPTPTPEIKEMRDDFSEKLEYVQKGAFAFIYIFRRGDGATLDAEDRKYLRANSPVETNQWVLTDDGRAAIAGSNYQFPPEMLDALKKRFNVEDLSEPGAAADEEEAANSNAGNKANSNAKNKANSKASNEWK